MSQIKSTKKGSTKGKAKGSNKTDESAPRYNAEVALLLANLLAHPSTPREIYKAVGEALTEIEKEAKQGGTATDSVPAYHMPEHIERVLNAQEGMGYQAFGLFNKGKRPDGYARFDLAGYDGNGRR